MARIVLDNITKKFGSVVAVDQVSLTVNDGEFFALLGPSGCGKTTTLRMIAGLELPNDGTISIGDREVTGLAPRERDVAMVFQDYALYPHMSILENIGYPLKVRGVNKTDLRARVTEAAESLDIEHLLERRPGQLSGGQQQRAAVARAIVHHAQVFLFDEPLSNLDAKLRLEARGFLKHLQHEIGVTTVYVTHDQAEAMALADRIAIMENGKVVQVGTAQEVYRRPQTVFVASFLGNPPMNLLPCHVDSTNERLVVDGATLSLDGVPQWNAARCQPEGRGRDHPRDSSGAHHPSHRGDSPFVPRRDVCHAAARLRVAADAAGGQEHGFRPPLHGPAAPTRGASVDQAGPAPDLPLR